MPTYEYECAGCGHAFEMFQSITAKPAKKCPECGKQKLERLIGVGGAVLFKGSGFYETDYRSDSYKQAAKAETDSKSSESASKSDSKSADTGKSNDTQPKKDAAKSDSGAAKREKKKTTAA